MQKTAILSLRQEIDRLSSQTPKPNSPADREIISYPNKKLIQEAFLRGILLVTIAKQNFTELESLVVQKLYPIAPYICARSLLESAAVATWLLCDEINSKDRINRYFSYCYTNLIEQRKYFHYIGNTQKENKARIKISDLEVKAINAGSDVKKDKKNEIKYIGCPFPNKTSLIENQFKVPDRYRVLSGIAHGTQSFIWAHCFKKIRDPNGGEIGYFAVNLDDQKILLKGGIKFLEKVVLLHHKQFGCNLDATTKCFKEAVDRLNKNY
ncbi:MAG: hypothetical protein EHM45_13685 [Desulfobacteraceae bacterium]|nr:MAG: hypothetical protein EHM45_13685 [Desulfobacteraceae bacterium]